MVVPFVDPTTYINVGGPDNLASLEVRGFILVNDPLYVLRQSVGPLGCGSVSPVQ